MPEMGPNQSQQNELAGYLRMLPPDRQRELLDFARFLSLQGAAKSSARDVWRSLAGTLPDEDAKELVAIIAGGCEQIDAEAW
jgi:hypothetical protein